MELRGRGRPGKRIEILEARPITKEELADMQSVPLSTNVQSLTDRHIAIARLDAAGFTREQISEAMSITPQRITQLRGDPMYIRMVESFKEDARENLNVLLERMAVIGAQGLSLLMDQLESGELNSGAVADITFKTLDRLGLGPTQKNLNLNVGVNVSEELKAAIDAKEKVRRA